MIICLNKNKIILITLQKLVQAVHLTYQWYSHQAMPKMTNLPQIRQVLFFFILLIECKMRSDF